MKVSRTTCGLSLAVAALVVVGLGCDPKIIKDVEFSTNLPLLSEEIELGDKIANADSIRRSPSDTTQLELYLVNADVTLSDGGRIGQDKLRVESQPTESYGAKVGAIRVDDVPPVAAAPVMLTDLIPDLPDFLQAAVPSDKDINVTVPGQVLPTNIETISFGDFTSATFSDVGGTDTNSIVISLNNASPFPIGPVDIYLSATGDTAANGDVLDVVLQIPFTTIPANSTVASEPQSLGGATLPSPAYTLTKTTVPEATVRLGDLDNAHFIVTRDISALRISSGTATVQPQSFTSSETLPFTSTRLDLIDVTLAGITGPLANRYTLSFSNLLPTTVEVTYSLPDFRIPNPPTASGGGSVVPVVANEYNSALITVSKSQALVVTIDLAGAKLANWSSPGSAMDNVQIGLNIDLLGSGGEHVTVSENDELSITTELAALEIQEVNGRVPVSQPPITVDIDPFDLELKEDALPSGLDGLEAHGVSLQLDMSAYNTRVTADADLLVTVRSPSGAPLVEYNRTVSEQLDTVSTHTLILDQDSKDDEGDSPLDVINRSLENLFSVRETKIEVAGKVSITGDLRLVREGGGISGSRISIDRWSIASPLRFTVPALTFDARNEDQDGFDIALTEGVRKDIMPKISTMTLKGEVENYFPLGGAIVLFLSSDPRFTALRDVYPADAKTNLTDIPPVIPEGVDITDSTQAMTSGAVWMLAAPTSLPEPTPRKADGSVDPDHPGLATITVAPDADAIRTLGHRKLYLLPRVQLQQPPGVVSLRANDFLKVSLWMQIAGQTNDEEVEEVPQ